MPPRRTYENRSSFAAARKIRETFVDREMTQVDDVKWGWPSTMREVGVCTAVMYTSDKWRKIGDCVDYKHVSEGPQQILVSKNFSIVDFKTSKPLRLHGETVDLEQPMPDAFAVLAKILGIQVQFYDADGEPGDFHQINIARATLGAAKHPHSDETFLLVYTPSELCAIIVGSKLDVERDGIVG